MNLKWRTNKRWLLLWLVLFIVATLIGCFDALGAYMATYPDETYALQREKALIWNLVKWNLWAFIAPAVVLLSRSLNLDRRYLIRNIPVHILCGICVALIHFALLVIIYSSITYNGDNLPSFLVIQFHDFTTDQFYVFISDFLVNVLLYSLILISAHALEFYREARAGQILAAQLEARLAQAQLQALKMQLHPHFLFNALHSISAQIKETDVARSMIARLGDFLRLTLENGGVQEVTLRQEIEFLRCYLDIEKTRFRDRLTVEMKIEPETWDARLPNLILQPLVENAIKHAVAPRLAPGRIVIEAARSRGNLRIQIQDNGSGMQNGNLKIAAENRNNGHQKGFGLQMTRDRLARLYSDAHRFELSNAAEGGLIVALEIPFRIEATEKVVTSEK